MYTDYMNFIICANKEEEYEVTSETVGSSGKYFDVDCKESCIENFHTVFLWKYFPASSASPREEQKLQEN